MQITDATLRRSQSRETVQTAAWRQSVLLLKRNKAEEYLKKYEKTAPKEAYYTFYRIESVPLFLSSHKVKINRPKHTTYPIGELVKLKISGEK